MTVDDDDQIYADTWHHLIRDAFDATEHGAPELARVLEDVARDVYDRAIARMALRLPEPSRNAFLAATRLRVQRERRLGGGWGGGISTRTDT